MGRKRIYTEVTCKEFVKETKSFYDKDIYDVNFDSVKWKQLYYIKKTFRIEIPKELLEKTKVHHGIYDLTKYM